MDIWAFLIITVKLPTGLLLFQQLLRQSITDFLALSENILGNFWLAECLQYLTMQTYRRPVYRLEVVLGFV